ncbi:MAG TPA: ATP-binding protein [Longimicrobiaceae bacterium]|nr:ATP-binding protein [Longimicrobiaceae bacterium]
MAAAALTAGLLAERPRIGEAHVALAYLLVVLGASARGGRRVGLGLSALCFLAFNFFVLHPYYTLAVRNPVDWLVLLAFVATAAVAAQLLHRAQSQADEARRRAEEIDQLATLGAETLKAPRARDAVVAIAGVIRAGLGVDLCEIYLRDEPGARLRRVASSSASHPAPSPETHSARGTGHPPSPSTHPESSQSDAVDEQRPGDAGPSIDPGDSTRAPEPIDPAGSADAMRALDSAEWDDGATVTTPELLMGTDARSWLLPLRVQGKPVGVLRLETAGGLSLDARQRRFAEALAYYAALGLERVRLADAALHTESLREADRLKDALLAAVSHDLRTPLTTIKALAHELAAGGDERAHVVETEADRLNRFVADLLDLARLNAGALPIRPELAAAEDVLGAALQQIAAVWPDRRVDASVEPGQLLVGRFDFVHTLHVLVNLVDNALKYSPADAAVEIAVRAADGRLAFVVADRGPGVAAGDREHVFEEFYRGDGGTAPGSGIGLALARRLAEAQGGGVAYEPRPGGGSVFTLSVAAVPPEELARLSL